MPTELPRLAGLTNIGYFSAPLDLLARLLRLVLPLTAQDGDVLHDRQPGIAEEALHHVFVHAGRRAQHARADVGDLGQIEQSLNGAVLAEGPVQHRKDDIHIDGGLGARLPARRCQME